MSITLRSVSAGYRGFTLDRITHDIPQGRLTALIGPNGCGKSTLFNTIAGLLPLRSGEIRIEGLDIARQPARRIARRVALLPQAPVVPPAVRVDQLVGYGRAPYQNLFGQRRAGDTEAIEAALDRAGMTALRHRRLSDLSGGQRQRAFVAMCLAQDTPVMLFDEPTSFLDIRYQYETLELLADLAAAGRTVVVVLHDIAQAARYAGHLVVMAGGRVRFAGPPDQVVTSDMLAEIYQIKARVYADPVTGAPQISPALRA